MHSKLTSLEAIVLGSSSYGDSDKIITFFTKEQGKLRGIAKSVKKLTSRKRPLLEPFSHIKLQITKSNLGVITDVASISQFTKIREDLRSMSVAFFLCESVQRSLADNATHLEVFEMLRNALYDLENGENKREIKENFTKDLLVTLGYVEDAESLVNPLKVFEEIIERKLGSARVGRVIQ